MCTYSRQQRGKKAGYASDLVLSHVLSKTKVAILQFVLSAELFQTTSG